jgi:hypothetical protein
MHSGIRCFVSHAHRRLSTGGSNQDFGSGRRKLRKHRWLIQDGDDRTFNGLTAALPAGSVVVLASQGGSVVPALEIGRAIRLKAFTTVVASNSLCASACALTWLAGTHRFMSANSHIGFHAAYRVVDGKSAAESGVNTKARYCWA